MMGFKEILRNDIEYFLNYEEFAGYHSIRYKIGSETIDLALFGVLTGGIREKSDSEKKTNRGLYTDYLNLYCKSEELTPQPHQGTLIYLDSKRYTVSSIEEQQGVIRLQLEGYHQ